MKNDNSMGKTFWERTKNRGKQLLNWSKDHVGTIALSLTAAAGGGYLLYRKLKGNGEEQSAPDVCYGLDPQMTERVHEAIDTQWPDPAESMGPEDDYPNEE